MPSKESRILIVDASLMIIQRLQLRLSETAGHAQVAAAYTYDEAIARLSASTFDVVVMDTQLPGRNGFELLGYIRQYHPGMTTIFFTNQMNDSYRLKAEAMGADHYTDKSADFDKLIDIIRADGLGCQVH